MNPDNPKLPPHKATVNLCRSFRQGIPYYYRSVRVKGKRKKIYIGNEAAAQQYIATETGKLQTTRNENQMFREMDFICEFRRTMMNYALVDRGYHRQNYSGWRLKRIKKEKEDPSS